MDDSLGAAFTGSRTRRRVLQAGAGVALARLALPLRRAAAATRPARVTPGLVPATAPLYLSWVQDQTHRQYLATDDLAYAAQFMPVDFSDVMTRMHAALVAQIPALARWRPYVEGELAIALLDAKGVERAAAGLLQALLALGGLPVTAPPAAVGTGGVVVLMHALDPAAGWTYASEILQETANDLGTAIDTKQQGETEINWVAGDHAAGRTGLAIAQLGDTTVLGETLDDLAAIIDASTGDADALADFKPFATARAALRGDVWLSGFANGPALVDLASDPLVSSLLRADAYTGLACWAAKTGIRLDAVALPVDAPAPAEPSVVFADALAAQVPSNPALYWSGVDLGKSPVAGALVDLIAAPALTVQLLPLLTGEFALALTTPRRFAASSLNATLTSDVADAVAVTAALSVIAAATPVAAGSDGSYTGQLTVNDKDSLPLHVEVAADRLTVSLGGKPPVIAADTAKPLAKSTQFRDTIAALPAIETSVVYLDLHRLLARTPSSAGTGADALPGVLAFAAAGVHFDSAPGWSGIVTIAPEPGA